MNRESLNQIAWQLFSLFAFADPAGPKGKAAPRAPAIAGGGWTNTHTWIAVVVGLLCVGFVAFVLLLGLFLWLRSRRTRREATPVRVVQSIEPKVEMRGPSLFTEHDRAIREDLARDDTLAQIQADRRRWFATQGFHDPGK